MIMDNTSKQLQDSILSAINQMIKNSTFDKTVSGIVKENVGGNKYNVEINGIIYTNVPTNGGTCTVNEIVKVLVPQNNFNNILILKSSSGGGGGGAVSSVNGMTGDVVLTYTDIGALSASLDTNFTSTTKAPQSKAVGDRFDSIESLIGDINDILDTINGEVI